MVNMTLASTSTPVASSSKLSPTSSCSARSPTPTATTSSFPSTTNGRLESDERNGDDATLHLLNPLSLHLQTDPKRGRGVYAPRRLHAHTLIEKSPTLIFSSEDYTSHDLTSTLLGSYTFTWQNAAQALCLGLGSLFNHSPTPNVSFKKDYTNGLMEFWTSRVIEEGEELNICYSADESKLWFKPDYAEGQEAHDEKVNEDEDPMSTFLNNLSDADEDIIVPIANPKRGPDGARLNSRPKEESRKERVRSKRKPVPAVAAGPSTPTASEPPTRSVSESSSTRREMPVPLPAPILSDLPPPLHSTGGKELGYVGGSADLVDPIDYDETYWDKRANEPDEEGAWEEIERIKGNVDTRGKDEAISLGGSYPVLARC